MKKFEQQFKEFYDNIKADEKLKKQILLSCLNQKEEKKNLNNTFTKKILFAIYSFLIIALFGTSLVFATDIKDFINTYIFKIELNQKNSDETNKEIYDYIIKIPVNEKVNFDNDLNENIESIKKSNLEEKIGIHLLTSDWYEDDLFYKNYITKVDNKLASVSLKKEEITTESNYFKANVEDAFIPNKSKINLSASFLTQYGVGKVDENAFKLFDYTDKKIDIIKMDSLNTDIYFVPFYTNMYDDRSNIEHLLVAHFIYEDVLYTVKGEWISKNTVLNFIKTLHY